MAYQTIFKRYELKYLLSAKQREQLIQAMQPYMALDRYGHSVIRNIYYDTDSYRLIRRSLEKPAYKEKLRVRSYARADENSAVFVELKKKYESVVYKRRTVMPEHQASEWLCGGDACPLQTQITKEIDYFCSYYETLHPVVFLSYEREAFYSLDNDDFRVTLDENILFREEELSLESEVWGTPILEKGQVLMEIKTSGGIPLWMAHFLSQNRIRKTSFSKYGTAYQMLLLKKRIKQEEKYMPDMIFRGLFDTEMASAISVLDFLICVGCSLAIGLSLAFAYMYRTRYTKSFVVTLAMLPAVVCVVIMMVNGNVGTGVAVAGAFSLVRFRSVPGTAREIGALFLAMGAGLIAGMGYLGFAFLFVLILGGMLILYTHLDFGTLSNNMYKTLHITIPEDLDYTGVFDDLFSQYTSSCELTNVKTTNMGSLYKLTYNIVLRDAGQEKELIDNLRCRNGNLEIGISNMETGQPGL